ncbi:putative Ig domain-containing protein [Streptantibioticus rubrisoli]|uniref:Ig domain-containing protein n=1 Tax=Streptantibioticus rubrisoli TaxID=1387313 RepID=A0ABT1PH40_9ACTN|nr:putative Ig domain-containing protein [Streptantibioticus rubrisoli]MCQ4043635.1 putative Ig domain-containing protein [Streptantibioticus rubrisoli]
MARTAATALLSTAALVSGGLLAATPSSATPVTGTASSPSTVHTRNLCDQHTAPGREACLAVARTDVMQHLHLSPSATPSGYGPSDLQSAYNLPSASAGSGQTVAIVDAQDDPNAESDLATYRSQYGLPACTTANGCFKKIDQNGGTNYPTGDTGWAGEISLDVDMVSAICPQCHILLVEANSASMSDLGAAVNQAVAQGAKYVSNSYGGSEDATDTSSDSQYFNHPGVAITVSSGDSDYGAEYPAASQYVTSVGGTSLTRDSSARGWSESVWNTSSTEGTGSGCSAYDPKPSWQTDSGCSKRTISDVSAVADPATGVAVYQTYGGSGWNVYGGTSASSPIIASVYALAGTPAASSYPASYPYAHTSALNDVTSGNNGSCSPSYLCTAGPGYDGPTGWGTPNGTAAFTGGSSTGNTVTVTNPGNQSTAVNTSVSLQIKASDSASGQTLSYGATGLPAGLSINSSTGLITGTPTTAGTSNVTVTAKDSTGASGSTSFTWTVTGSGGGGCTGKQLLGNPGFETGTAAPWSATSGVINNDTTSEPAHSGNWDAWLDGYGSTHTDTLSQSVTIPTGCHATFSFWLHIDTAETTSSTAYDTLKVQAGSTTLATYSNLNASNGYVQKSFDVSSLAGQTVTLKFTGVEDSSLQTSFVIDDTALNIS